MKNRSTIAIFAAILAFFAIGTAVLPDADVSCGERRTLAKHPEVSLKTLLNGTFAEGMEEYMPDQLIMREPLRQSALLLRTRLLGQRDYKGVYVERGYACEAVWPYSRENVEGFAQRVAELSALFPESGVWCAVIPDKTVYAGGDRLTADYGTMLADLSAAMKEDARLIDLSGALGLEDYYKTDVHWRQERLSAVVETLGGAMGFSAEAEYDEQSFSPFYGSFYSRAAGLEPDELIWLESVCTKSAVVENHQQPDFRGVYDTDRLGKMDSYDVFLSGATPFTVVTNTMPDEAARGRGLVIFRDSFGSSIAPLLLPAYERITLIDLRYMTSALLPEMVSASGQDLLFLYGMGVINESYILK